MKLKLLTITIIAFLFSGCYTTTSLKSNETYVQSHWDVDIYIDYNFDCELCYYEMYWCYNCQTYHVHVNRWCHNHYYWYNNWYSVYYYHPHTYYYGHYTNHVHYRDVTRHYIRDYNGLRNTRGGRTDNIFRTKEYKNDRNNDVLKQRDTKKYDTNLKQRYNETHKNQNKTYQKPNDVKRENKTYQRQNNTQRRNTQKPSVKQNSGSKTMKKR